MGKSKIQQRVLIVKLGAFGDIIMSDGAFRDIRRQHVTAHITVLTTAPYHKIMLACPHIDAVILDPRAPRWKFWILQRLKRRLQESFFDIVYDLQDNARTALYFKWMHHVPDWSGTQKRARLRYTADNPKLIPALERMAGQLEQAGLKIHHTLEPDLRWMGKGFEISIKNILQANQLQDGFILLIPGAASRHPEKRWPYFNELAQWLIAKGYQPVTAPGHDELDLCATLPSTMLMDGDKPLNFFQLSALVPHAGFVIGNDTGPTHLAAHIGTTKGLALFGGHTPARLTCVERKFEILETKTLDKLTLKTVTEKLLPYLANPTKRV